MTSTSSETSHHELTSPAIRWAAFPSADISLKPCPVSKSNSVNIVNTRIKSAVLIVRCGALVQFGLLHDARRRNRRHSHGYPNEFMQAFLNIMLNARDAMTAHAFSQDRERFLAAGINGYVAKPIDLEKLFKQIEQLYGGQKE